MLHYFYCKKNQMYSNVFLSQQNSPFHLNALRILTVLIFTRQKRRSILIARSQVWTE